MTAGKCVFCGRGTRIEHHITGRALDVNLAFPHCHNHHTWMHDDWFSAGAGAKALRVERSSVHQEDPEAVERPPTVLHVLYLRLRRLGMWLGRLAAQGISPPLTEPLARSIAQWANALARCIAALDAHQPGWGNAPGITFGSG